MKSRSRLPCVRRISCGAVVYRPVSGCLAGERDDPCGGGPVWDGDEGCSCLSGRAARSFRCVLSGTVAYRAVSKCLGEGKAMRVVTERSGDEVFRSFRVIGRLGCSLYGLDNRWPGR